MNKIKKSLIFLSVFILVSCTMPGTRIYTVYLPVENKTTDMETGASIAVHVNSERYLKQPYIAYRSSFYQLKISKYSKWESSPGRLVREAFRYSLSSKGLFKEVSTAGVVPEGFYLLRIYLRGFERFDLEDGSFGRLEFDAALFDPGGGELYRDTVSMDSKLDNQEFVSLAKGLSDTLKQAIEEVRADVVKAIRDNK